MFLVPHLLAVVGDAASDHGGEASYTPGGDVGGSHGEGAGEACGDAPGLAQASEVGALPGLARS